MLGVSAVPGVLLLGAVLAAVESPRWLVRAGRRDEARATIARARPWVDPDVCLASIEASLRDEPPNASWAEVFAPAWRRPLTIGISATFWLFALFCVAGGIFVWHLVPETKGRSLEQIQALWSGRGAPTISPAGVFR